MNTDLITRSHDLLKRPFVAGQSAAWIRTFPSGNAGAWFRPKAALVAGIVMILAGTGQSQTLIDIGATAPIPGTQDIAQLSAVGNQIYPDGLNYNTVNQVAYQGGEPGQTFTTGNSVGGYTLSSLSFMTAGLGSASGVGTPSVYNLHIYSVSGSTATVIDTFTSSPVAFSDGDWLQWSNLSVSLDANATYAYSFGLTSDTGSEALGVSSGYPYTGGQIGLFPPGGGVITFGASQSFDAIFDLGLGPPNLPTLISYTLSPMNNVFVGTPVTFTATVTGAAPLYLQWQFNNGSGFADIPGATSDTLALDAAVTNTGSYELVLTNSHGALTSAPITLTVTHDTTPPTALLALVINLTNVEVEFSKLLDASSATNIANYAFTNGLAITGATLGTNNMTVLLTTAPLAYGSNYTLIINGVLDQAIPPNTIAGYTAVSFIPSPLTTQDIGSPAIASTFTVTSINGVKVTSSGTDIGGTSDQFNLEYQLETGDFDVSVCVASLGLSGLWAQAGLMARASLSANSAYAAALATPGVNGDSFSYRAGTAGTAFHSGSFPPIIRIRGCDLIGPAMCSPVLAVMTGPTGRSWGRPPLRCPARFTLGWRWPATPRTRRLRRSLSIMRARRPIRWWRR